MFMSSASGLPIRLCLWVGRTVVIVLYFKRVPSYLKCEPRFGYNNLELVILVLTK
jgi:hypothetical protein